jgi:hypothetical protein
MDKLIYGDETNLLKLAFNGGYISATKHNRKAKIVPDENLEFVIRESFQSPSKW